MARDIFVIIPALDEEQSPALYFACMIAFAPRSLAYSFRLQS